MKRDTRNNLIFIAIMLPLLIPGAVLLFKAKLDPEAKRMFQPDFVRSEVLYNNYDDQRPTDHRLVPSMTSQWIQSEAFEMFHPALRAHVTLHTGRASQEHRFEVAGVASSQEAGTFVLVVVWDPNMTSPVFKLGEDVMAQVANFTKELPPAVRKELQKAGFVKPPANVRAYLLQSKEPASGQPLVATYQTKDGKKRMDQLTALPWAQHQEAGSAQLPAASYTPSTETKNSGTTKAKVTTDVTPAVK